MASAEAVGEPESEVVGVVEGLGESNRSFKQAVVGTAESSRTAGPAAVEARRARVAFSWAQGMNLQRGEDSAQLPKSTALWRVLVIKKTESKTVGHAVAGKNFDVLDGGRVAAAAAGAAAGKGIAVTKGSTVEGGTGLLQKGAPDM